MPFVLTQSAEHGFYRHSAHAVFRSLSTSSSLLTLYGPSRLLDASLPLRRGGRMRPPLHRLVALNGSRGVSESSACGERHHCSMSSVTSETECSGRVMEKEALAAVVLLAMYTASG